MHTIGYSQNGTITISGQVRDNEGEAIAFASVALKNTKFGTTTDPNGNFQLSNIPKGSYTIVVQFLGYEPAERQITITSDTSAPLIFNLSPGEVKLNEVMVSGKSKAAMVRQEAYAVTAIDAKPLKNTTSDINMVLNRSTGVRIREEGGMGSNFSLSLNGFSGNQVKFFMDGIPMDSYGSSLTLNNIPVNMIERVEVYKGVVPANLGADALGGAVNILTDQAMKSFVDVSYSYGSFNTHRASLIGRHTFENGTFINASLFGSYSDNNYWIDIDTQNGTEEEAMKVRRFHDGYKSASGQLEAGLVGKPFADKLSLSIIASGNHKELQNGNNLKFVFGQAYYADDVVIANLKYSKKNFLLNNLDLNQSFSSVFKNLLSADSSARVYAWDGSYTLGHFGAQGGEYSEFKRLLTLNDRLVSSISNLGYTVSGGHSFSVNNTFSFLRRVGSDPLDPDSVAFEDPNIIRKNVFAVSYQFKGFNNKLNTIFFVKNFSLRADLIQDNQWDGSQQVFQRKFNRTGFGLASTCFVLTDWQWKISVENTYRLPEGDEMFGDGMRLLGNASLLPEESLNINAGSLANMRFGKHHLGLESNFLYRNTSNFIRLDSDDPLNSQYKNVGRAQTTGVESRINYSYRNFLNVELNGTWQRIVNITPNDNDKEIYNVQLPNQPILFGNLLVGLQFNEVGSKQNNLNFLFTALYVDEFYLKWPIYGTVNQKHTIPSQLLQSVSVTWSMKQGRYNFTAECLNIMDKNLYDNFRQQKPGRMFVVKFRIFLKK
jgi:outer membrane cobalamin receptor